MEIMHRYNSNERQHYLLERHYTFKLKPRLLYVGSLDKHGGWREEPHSHHFLEVIFVSDGSGTVVIEDQSYDVHRGDLLVYCILKKAATPILWKYCSSPMTN